MAGHERSERHFDTSGSLVGINDHEGIAIAYLDAVGVTDNSPIGEVEGRIAVAEFEVLRSKVDYEFGRYTTYRIQTQDIDERITGAVSATYGITIDTGLRIQAVAP